MPSAVFNKFTSLAQDLGSGEHDWTSDTLKIALTNSLPTAGDANWNLTDHPAPAAVNGYPVGGNTLTGVTYTSASLDATGGLQFVASGGQLGPFRYIVLYNSSSVSPTNAGIGWYDYGSSITLEDTETFTASIPNTLVTIN